MLPNAESGLDQTEQEIGDDIILTTHPDLTKPVKAFPSAEVQALNMRTAYAVAGGLVGRGFIKVDHNDPDHSREWTAITEAIQDILNSLQYRS